MTPRHFRSLLVVAVTLGLVGGFVDVAFPQLVPQAFVAAQEQQDNSEASWLVFIVGAFAILAGLTGVVSWVGLYTFRSWAPRLALASTALAFWVLPFTAVVAQSAVAATLVELSTLLWGVVLALAYHSSIATKFGKSVA